MICGGSWPSSIRSRRAASLRSSSSTREVGPDVRQSIEWTAGVLRDPVSIERAKLAFDTFVDPAEIDRVFAAWSGAFPEP